MPQRYRDDNPPFVCSNCGRQYQKGARFCPGCGWLAEKEPNERPAGPLESGRLLFLDTLQRKQIEEVCRFLDHQIQAGGQALDQQLQSGAQKLTSLALGRRIQERAGEGESQWPAGVSRWLTQVAATFRPAEDPEVAESPLFCLRCGSENRAQGRFCRRCGVPLMQGAIPTNLGIVVSLATDTGRMRELNEDRAQVWHANVDGWPTWLAALADGMGGEQAGEVASGIVMDTVGECWKTVVSEQALAGREKSVLAEIVHEANRRVYTESNARPGQQGMGTTCTLLLCRKGMAYLANVGDSRAYLFDKSGGLNQVTQDHSLVAVLIAIGQITAEEAMTHEQRNVLYRCVGREPSVEVDTFARRLEPGDHLLLCSDGLTLHLMDEEIARMVNEDESPLQICQRLITAANERGGEDNISVVLVEVGQDLTQQGDLGRTEE